MSLPDITTPNGRRAWSFLAIAGGCMVFTVFAAVGLYLVRNHPNFTFWLALAAHLQVFVGMTAFGWVMGRRMSGKAGRDGFEFNDAPAAAQLVADEAQAAADIVKES